MTRPSARTKAALLWGVVAGLAFLVLLQAYHLTGGAPVGLPASAGAAAVATVGGGALAYLAEGWLARRGGTGVGATPERGESRECDR